MNSRFNGMRDGTQIYPETKRCQLQNISLSFQTLKTKKMSTNTTKALHPEPQKKLSSHAQSQCLPRSSTYNDYMLNCTKMIKSQCLTNSSELALLLQTIGQYENDICEKEMLYARTVQDLAAKIGVINQDNNSVKAEIYQLKDEARKIKKQSDGLKQGLNGEKIQKCYSARELFHSAGRSQNNVDSYKSSTNIYRMTLPHKNAMF